MPKTIAGNSTVTTIGGKFAGFGPMRRGTTVKNVAAKKVIASHCLTILESAWPLDSSGKDPDSGQRLPAVRARRSAALAVSVRLPIGGRPKASFATFKKNRSPRVTVISSQGTKKSRE